MLIRSGDIRDQSRQLSEIAQNFGRFFALSNFLGRAFQNLHPFYHPCLAARRPKKFLEDNPTRPEVIRPPGTVVPDRTGFSFTRDVF